MALCPVAKNSFKAMADKLPLDATVLFESMEQEEHHIFQTLLGDHLEGGGIIVNPRPTLRMRIEILKCHCQIFSSNQRHISNMTLK